jgi:hypothetical protein
LQALEHGLAALTAADPALARAVAEAGPPAFDLRPEGFETLVRAIVAQQVSAASARAIFGRLCEAVQPLTPSAFLAAGPEAIRALSRLPSPHLCVYIYICMYIYIYIYTCMYIYTPWGFVLRIDFCPGEGLGENGFPFSIFCRCHGLGSVFHFLVSDF